MIRTRVDHSRTSASPSSRSRYLSKFPLGTKSYIKKHSPRPFEQQMPLNLTRFSCLKEVKIFNPLRNSASSTLQLFLLTLLIATTDPSLRTPRYTAENPLLPNKFPGEKYWVAHSTSSRLNLNPWITSLVNPPKPCPSDSGSHPLGYSRLIKGDPFFLESSLGWSVLGRTSDNSEELPCFCLARLYLVMKKTLTNDKARVATTAPTATEECDLFLEGFEHWVWLQLG
uniref:Uncharacterized protein n=1 Tax=Opuntia streptacantha TaxID=393608 RepID=A0A7C9AF67_OPUST